MPYTHFRYIAWNVPTATYIADAQTDGISGWDPGMAPAAVARLPVSAAVTESDSRVRLLRLAAVVNTAARLLASNAADFGADDANTLKIFIVPEFYFRPRKVSKEYSHNTYPDRVAGKIFQALNAMFVHADFQHWLFVCGTVMWNQLAYSEDKPGFFNTAVVVRGGAPNRLTLVEKQLASTIDGVPIAFSPGELAHLKQIFSEWKARRLHIFDDAGVTFGVEVCLDHLDEASCRVLKRVLMHWPSNEKTLTPQLKFHLLTAGGMHIQPRSVAAKVGGYILRNDGMANNDTGPQVQMGKVTGYTAKSLIDDSDFPTYPADLGGVAALDFTGITAKSYAIPAGSHRVPVPAGGAYLTMTQRLIFFNTLPMPG